MSEQVPEPRTTDPVHPGMPRWVKVAGIVVLVLVALFLVLQLTGLAGDHGPGRHVSQSVTSPVGVAPDGGGGIFT